jgi:hypothetical protein
MRAIGFNDVSMANSYMEASPRFCETLFGRRRTPALHVSFEGARAALRRSQGPYRLW